MNTKDLRRRPTILCIDDDPALTTAMCLRLSQYDVDVVCAYFGNQGIWTAVTERPDVIVTDLRMPNGDGDDVIECLKGRSDTCDIPVIVLTGRRDRAIERWMRTLGVACYLRKPLPFERLLDALRRYIELRPLATTWVDLQPHPLPDTNARA